VTNTQNCFQRSMAVATTKPDHVFLSLWNWLTRRSWKNLEKKTRVSLGCCKQSLMGNSHGRSEDQNDCRNVDSESQTHKVLYGNEDSVGNWTRGHSCYILTKNLSTFCLYPETLNEA
jgi:hypothetical protein